MNHIRVHYNPATGAILAWDNALSGEPLLGGEITVFNVPEGHVLNIDPTSQRIDLDTLALEDMADHEIAAARGPQVYEIKQIIALELVATDSYGPVSDRPVTDRDAWLTYRQALRDASKGEPAPTPLQMLNAIPLRPDGRDAAALLRARLTQD